MKLKKKAQQSLMKTPRACVATGFEPDLRQKRVDMEIGLDVVWLFVKGDGGRGETDSFGRSGGRPYSTFHTGVPTGHRLNSHSALALASRVQPCE